MIDAIGAVINASGRRCYVMDTESAAGLYAGEDEIDTSEMDLSQYDAILLPFLHQEHWRLAVADLTLPGLYYLDPDWVDVDWSPDQHIMRWCRSLVFPGQRRNWAQRMWPPPQQIRGVPDCGVAITLFIMQIARGEGLPPPGRFCHGEAPQPPMVSSVQIYNFRARIVACILFATLEPTGDLETLQRGIVLQYAPYRERPVWALQERVTDVPPGTYPPPNLWSLVNPGQDPRSLVEFPRGVGRPRLNILNFSARNSQDDLRTWQVHEVIRAADDTLPLPQPLLSALTRRGLRPLRPIGASRYSILSAIMCSLPPPFPNMTGHQMLRYSAAWFSHLWNSQDYDIEGSWGRPVRQAGYDDFNILQNPSLLLSFPSVLLHA